MSIFPSLGRPVKTRRGEVVIVSSNVLRKILVCTLYEYPDRRLQQPYRSSLAQMSPIRRTTTTIFDVRYSCSCSSAQPQLQLPRPIADSQLGLAGMSDSFNTSLPTKHRSIVIFDKQHTAADPVLGTWYCQPSGPKISILQARPTGATRYTNNA